MSVAILSSLKMVNSTQSQSMALHAATQSQLKTWVGAELVGTYLRLIASDSSNPSRWTNDLVPLIESASIQNPVPLATGIDELSASVVRYEQIQVSDGASGTYGADRVTVDISGQTGSGTKAKSSATIRVIYQYEPGGQGGGTGSGGGGPEPVFTFNHDLRLGGDIRITTPENQDFAVNVIGELDASYGNSITGVNIINATDSIIIGSGSSFDQLNSNGDIRLTGSVSGDKSVSARGNVCTTGGTSVGMVRANGFVYGTGSAAFGPIEALGNSSYNGSSPKCSNYTLNDTNGNPFAVNMAGNNFVESVKAKGSTRFDSGTVSSGVQAEGDLRDTNWGGSQNGTIGGTVENPGNNPQVPASINIVESFSVDIVPVQEIVLEASVFDAYIYRNSANYALYYEDGNKRISVKNVSDIPDGDYYLASNTSVNGPKYDRICTNSACTGVSYPFCKGWSDWNACFSYNAGTKTWSINGKSLSPGVVWVEGNLNPGNGTYYNTFIATGNIYTSGSHRTVAPNFAGYDGGHYSNAGVSMDFAGICTNATFPHYPTQLCSEDGSFNPGGSDGLTNFAYMAGSLVGDEYAGGDITLGASTLAFGSVLAGDTYNSGGDTTIFGYVTAQGQATTTAHQMGGSTKIIVDVLPPTYVPMGGSSIFPPSGSTGPGTLSVLWSRYL
ncbi:MAG: hypothetical protein CMK32_06045 [Porticoccaceae bacterium]|nr:hypothetical protein [Porticoccaceae bacterium]